jgi:5-deoxy-glucuronate isomerase
MIRDSKYPLVAKPSGTESVYQYITAEEAGWDLLHFCARRLKKSEKWEHSTNKDEYVLVILGGKCTLTSKEKIWENVGRRPNVFKGMPYAFYIPRQTEFILTAESGELDIAYGWCSSDKDFPLKLITPPDIEIEIRGGGNATRQINNIVPPGFNCSRLVVVEVYTPSGNWSSYPPHKHDVHNLDANGKLLEAELVETYFYKIDHSHGYAIQHVYTEDRTLDELSVVRNNDVVLIPKGYHPVAAPYGYNVYYLNFLAGTAQSLANKDDPEHAWIKENWGKKDPRLPLVSLEMEK